VQEWIVSLLGRYGGAYASNQFRALHQLFKWLVAEEVPIRHPTSPALPFCAAGREAFCPR
jgi:hypothetical protein